MDAHAYDATALVPLILYVDNHLLAVNKPAGWLTQDSGTGLPNLEDWAREWVRVDKQKPGNVFLNAVHRIDRAVSGVVLFARTSKALARLNEDIRQRQCTKIYHARVEGTPRQETGELVHWLAHEDRRAVVVREGARDARRAVLRYRTLASDPTTALLEIDLETGRYHQIRAQLAAIGCPIAGDSRYGAHEAASDGTIALHHVYLEFMHPVVREMICIRAPYPATSWWGDLPAGRR